MITFIGANEPEYSEICALLQTVSTMTGHDIKTFNADRFEKESFTMDDIKNIIFIVSMGWRKQDLWTISESGIHIFLFAWNSLYDPWNSDFLLKLRDKAVTERNYHFAKGINDILIESDWITQRTEVLGMPKELQLESTSRCNAHCIMCEHYYTDNNGCGELTREALKSLTSAFPYIREIFMHGLGEPMLYSDLRFFLQYLLQYQIKANCNSNMSVLPKDLLSLMDEAFHGISISCDGCDEETFSQIRQGLSFDNFLTNVELLHKKAPHIELRMSIVAMRQNITQIPEIIDFAHTIGVEAVQVAYMVPNPVLENDLDCLHHYPAHTKKYLKEAAERADSYGMRAAFPDTTSIIINNKMLEAERKQMEECESVQPSPAQCRQKLKNITIDIISRIQDMQPDEIHGSGYFCRGICDYLLEKPYVDHNGDVFLCCINPAYRMGNVIRDGGLETIWNSDNYKKIREVFYNGEIPNCCMNCQFIINRTLPRIREIKLDEKYYRKFYPNKDFQEFIINSEDKGGTEKT